MYINMHIYIYIYTVRMCVCVFSLLKLQVLSSRLGRLLAQTSMAEVTEMMLGAIFRSSMSCTQMDPKKKNNIICLGTVQLTH